MSNHPEIELQASDGTVKGNIFINGSDELVFREAENGNQIILQNDGFLDIAKIAPDEANIASELGLPEYDDVSNGPQTQGRLVYATGNGTSSEGIYKHNGSSYSQVGGGLVDGENFDGQSTSDFSNLNSLNTDKLNTADASTASQGDVLKKSASGTDLSFGTLSTGGVTYTQSSSPSSPSVGETWYDTDNGIYRAYADLGGGADWQPIPPVQITEEASSFTESDVSITKNETLISNGSIKLGFANTYDITTADGSSVSSFDVSGEDTDPKDMAWNDDGSKVYMIGRGSSHIYEYPVSTPYDITTADGSSVSSFQIYGEDQDASGMTWNDDGSKVYMIGEGSDSIYEYPVSTPYDITTADGNTVSSFDVSGEDINPQGMAWNDDGSKVYMIGEGSFNIYEYPVSTPYDITTADGNTVSSFDVSGEDYEPKGMAWNDDGSKLYMVGTRDDNIYEYPVSTPYDITTADSNSVSSFDVSGEDINPQGMAWNDDGSKLYMVGQSNDNIYEYPVGTDATSGDALVEWNSGVPADIDSYDLAAFQETLDSETVTVDIEDGSGNTLFSDIGQNFDISTVDTSKNVTIRVNLSRNDTSNNPTLDYAARRFTR